MWRHNPKQYTLNKTIDLNQIEIRWTSKAKSKSCLSMNLYISFSWFGVCREEVRDLKFAGESGEEGLPPPLPPQLLPGAKLDFDAPNLVWSDLNSVPRYDACFKVSVIGWMFEEIAWRKNIMLSHTHHNIIDNDALFRIGTIDILIAYASYFYFS